VKVIAARCALAISSKSTASSTSSLNAESFTPSRAPPRPRSYIAASFDGVKVANAFKNDRASRRAYVEDRDLAVLRRTATLSFHESETYDQVTLPAYVRSFNQAAYLQPEMKVFSQSTRGAGRDRTP